MRNAITCLVRVAGLAAIMSAAALAEGVAFSAAGLVGKTVLENASVRIVLSGNRMVSLLDKTRTIEHVVTAPKRAAGLFRIQWIMGIQPAGELDASQMTARVARRIPQDVELEFEHAQASVRVHIALAETQGESQWSLSVTPKDPALAVGHVAFPVLVTPASADGQEKHYLFPMFEGRLQALRNPPLWRSYPAELFAQMTACLAPAGGFLLWTDDSEGNSKAFGFQRGEGTAAFAVRHQAPYVAGQEWRMSYHTRISFCGGAWQDAAEIYRAWVTQQPWSGTAIRDRRDMPEFLKAPPLCLSTQLDKENLETLPERLAAWGKRFGAPIVYRPLGWEKYGNWVGIDYFPPAIGEGRFRDLAARLKERGIAMAGFISGYRWTTKSSGVSQGDNEALRRFFDEQKGEQVCERMRDGTLLAFQSEGRDSYRICRGTEFGRQFLQTTAASLFDLGVPIIHDDQDHGPTPTGHDSCFNPSHGHPVPAGPWSTAVTRDAFRQIRAEATRRGLKDFLLTKESPSELLNMDLHAYQARNFHESSTPGCVPLAQFLYHEQIPVIFGWVTANSPDTWDLAAMIIYGQIPSLAFWNASADRPERVPPEGLMLLEDYYAAMKTYAKDFLLYGRMRRPLIPDAPMLDRKKASAKAGKASRSLSENRL